LGPSTGRYVADATFDRHGSYAPAFAAIGVALIAATELVNGLGPYAYPSRRDFAI
jgi:hypothetical protein